MWEYIIGFVIGCAVTILIFKLCYRSKGTLQIDHSNPDKDVWRFVFDKYEDLSRKKHITVKIDNNADLSQK